MKIERVISWFNKDTDVLIGEFKLNQISLKTLKTIFHPSADDPLMYNPYTIYLKEAQMLGSMIDFHFDFEKYVYQVDCFQV